MRKLYILILSFIVVFIGLLYVSSLKPSTNQFKVIRQSYGYVYKNDKRMEFDLYSKDNSSIIENVEVNSYFLSYDGNKNILNNVLVSKTRLNDYFIYKISFDIIKPISEELIIENAKLVIENKDFLMSVEVGNISVLNKEIEQLEFSDVYASYAYINNALLLVGINIELANDYNRISNLSVNNMTYTDTNLLIDGSMYENEIDIKSIIPKYRYNSILRSHRKIETKTLFIPVTYKDLIVIKGGYIIITLDGCEYLINEFDFIFNNLDINDYQSYIEESINVKA